MPAEAAQLDAFLYIALFVAFYFLFPEWGVALGHYKVAAAFVAVPEAAVDEDDGAVLAQYYVGGAGQALDIYAVAIAVGMQVTAHNQLGLGVLALDACHALVPLFFCHSVCHVAKILFSMDILLVPLFLIIWTQVHKSNSMAAAYDSFMLSAGRDKLKFIDIRT